MASMSCREVLLLASLLSAATAVPACGSNPVGPTAVSDTLASQTSGVMTAPESPRRPASVDLARCAQARGDASCLGARATAPVPASAARTEPPGPPANLVVTVSGNRLSLSWTASPNVADYILQVGSAPGLSDIANYYLNSLETSYSGTVSAGTYYIRIVAWNGANSIPSNEVVAVVGACAGPPTDIRNLADGVDNPTATIWLQWEPPASGAATSYVVEAGSSTGRADLGSFDTGDASTYFFTQGVAAGTYYVRVRARSSCGLSAPSNEIVITMGGGGRAGCPGPPRQLTVVSQSAGTISLSWLPPASGSARSYLIEAGSAPGLSDLARLDTFSTETTYTVSNVAAGRYYVRLRAAGACGFTDPSNEVLVYVVAFDGEVEVSVSWDAASDVDLHVVDPSGEEIYWGNTTSASGGQLTTDSNSSCSIDGRQIENVRWRSGAPAGTYAVRVDYWSSCNVAQTNYTVTVKNGGSTSTYTGTFTGTGDRGGRGSGRSIASFTHVAAFTSGRLPVSARLPALVEPSPEKLKLSAASR